MTTAKRWVHRDKETGLFAVAHNGGQWIGYDGTLQQAKIYTAKRGGTYRHPKTPDDYEWVAVYLTLEEPAQEEPVT